MPVTVSLLYPRTERFDFSYYRERHLPLAARLLAPFGLARTSILRGAGGTSPGSPPDHAVIALLELRSLEDLGAALAAHGEELFADMGRFTDAMPVVQVNVAME